MSTATEIARDWYDAYGWHLTDADGYDHTLQTVDYDWLDELDDAAIISDHLTELDAEDAAALVARAREVRAAAEEIGSVLEDAARAHEAGCHEAMRMEADAAACADDAGRYERAHAAIEQAERAAAPPNQVEAPADDDGQVRPMGARQRDDMRRPIDRGGSPYGGTRDSGSPYGGRRLS